jgi:hypothetical protein
VTESSRVRLLWGALAAAALLPRVLGALWRRPWHDEYFTAWVASRPWRELLPSLQVDSGPPLPYVLTKLLATSGLPAIDAARLLTVLAGTAAVLLAARSAERAFGIRAAWWCGGLLALHPLALAWSCEGRAYAWLLLAAAWGWERLEAMARGERAALGLALAVALGCWSHAFGLILALALATAAFSLAASARRTVLLAIAGGVASHLPWLPIALAQPPLATAWMSRSWQMLPATEKLLAPVRLLPTLAPFGAQVDLPSAPGALQLLAAVLVLALLVPPARAARPWLLFGLPALGLAGVAACGVPAFYAGRGEALFLAPFVALLAAGAARGRARTACACALALGGLAMTALALSAWLHEPPRAEERLATTIRQVLPEGGTVVVGGYWRLGLWYHLRGSGREYELVNVPAAAARHPGWYDDAAERPAPGELAHLEARLRAHPGSVTVVVTPHLATTSSLEALARFLRLQPTLSGPVATLYSLPR